MSTSLAGGGRAVAVVLGMVACLLPVLWLVVVPLLGRAYPECECQYKASDEVNHEEQAPLVSAEELIDTYGHVEMQLPLGATEGDVRWVKRQLRRLQVGEVDFSETRNDWHQLRKGINPRTREQQLSDLRRYKGISHYPGGENQTALLCPGELLVEQHHSNYGEPWAGGRDVFEYLAKASNLKPEHRVLEVGCGTLRVGLHFIRHLLPQHYHCLERDALSLMAALMYEVPSQGLLHKRPVVVRSEELDIRGFSGDNGSTPPFDLIFASASFLHMPDRLVWKGLARLGPKVAVGHGRLFVSHNIKFCTRLPDNGCHPKLAQVGLEYVGKETHDSLLFNHYEVWHKFRRLVH